MNLAAGRPPSSLATPRSLLSRLKESNAQESWRQFFDTYHCFLFIVAEGELLMACFVVLVITEVQPQIRPEVTRKSAGDGI
jgi:hypothetical protein